MIIPLISIASYVLYALGLYTIAQRRGIRYAWLAWIPVGSVWILGSIADDFRARQTGRKHRMRIWLMVLNVAMVVMLVVVMVSTFAMLGSVLTVNEITDVFLSASGAENDLYAMSQEEMMEQLEAKLEARLTDEVAADMLHTSLVAVLLSLVMSAVAIAYSVLELICTYRLFLSCDPQHAVTYLLICILSGLLLNLTPVFVFLCREKDLGMQPPPPPVMGYMPPPPQDPWSQN